MSVTKFGRTFILLNHEYTIIMGVKSGKLKKKADQWIFDYDVPIQYEFRVKELPDNNPLAEHDSALQWSIPFIDSNVKNSEIAHVLTECYDNLHVDKQHVDQIEEQIEMLVSWGDENGEYDYNPTSRAERAGVNQLKRIEKDLKADIDEQDAVNTGLRTLYAELMKSIENGTVRDDDTIEILKEMRRTIETKSKMEGDMVEKEQHIHLGDMVNVEDLEGEAESEEIQTNKSSQ